MTVYSKGTHRINRLDPTADQALSGAPKPQAKANLIHQLILAGLVATRPASRTHKVWDASLKDGKGDVVQTTVSTGPALVNRLAQNVSEVNVDRTAWRWAA